MNRGLRIITLAIALVLILSPALSLSAQARDADMGQFAPKNKDVVSISMTPAQQKATLDSWTHEALASAQPLPLMVDAGSPSAAVSAAPEVTGEAGFAPAGFAEPGADQTAQAAYAEDWATVAEALAAAEEPTGTSQVFDSYVLNQYTQLWNMYPHKWVGRLSFRNLNGGTSYCSATAISGNVMLTAAHCLYETQTANRFYSNWVFTPAYRAGGAPFGSFPARTCWVLVNWVNYGGAYSINWAANDVGVCKMGTNSAGQTLNGAVGFMGRMWNGGYVYLYNNIGYPFQDTSLNYIANAGAYSWDCVAESRFYTTNVLGMGCNRGPGMSGGSWVNNYAPFQVRGWANGVNSGIFIGQMNIYAGRFTSNNIVPLCNAAGC